AGGYITCLNRTATALDTFVQWRIEAPTPHAVNQSSTKLNGNQFDLVLTDPPYYDAIPYSDLMDFFYVWLRRTPLPDGRGVQRAVQRTAIANMESGNERWRVDR